MHSPHLSLTWREPRPSHVAARFLRYTDAAAPQLSAGSISFDLTRHCVTLRGTRIRLGRIRTRLFYALVRNADRPVTFETLHRSAWSEASGSRSNRLTVHLCALRRIVSEHLGYDAIESLRGCGYRFATNSFSSR